VAFAVVFAAAAARDFRKLPADVQRRIRPKVDALAANPRPAGAEKLAGREDSYRIRIGDYRVLYRVEDEAVRVLVVRVAHRREAYR
jgi:mRNA interferase RelE/StbE